MTTFTRRLQRIGSSILVSLPKQWVDAHGLDKSAQVQIETTQNSLSITVDQGRKQSKEIEILYPLSSEENLAANITGAYLLGYDIITIKGKSTISVKDREVIRESMRRLVGMEILEEDASNINGQFLLDETSLNPEKIFKRMSSIALGMFKETLSVPASNIRRMSSMELSPPPTVRGMKRFSETFLIGDAERLQKEFSF